MQIEIDVSLITIETDRIILRPWKESDIDDLFEYTSVSGVGEMAGWKHHESIEQAKKTLDYFISEKSVFAIVYKQNNKAIGHLGLYPSWTDENEMYKHLKAKELGFVLSKEYWGKGLVSEAANAIIDYCFKNTAIEAFGCGHFIENMQSQRVIEKCGFSFSQNYEYYSESLQKTFDEKQYILLRQ